MRAAHGMRQMLPGLLPSFETYPGSHKNAPKTLRKRAATSHDAGGYQFDLSRPIVSQETANAVNQSLVPASTPPIVSQEMANAVSQSIVPVLTPSTGPTQHESQIQLERIREVKLTFPGLIHEFRETTRMTFDTSHNSQMADPMRFSMDPIRYQNSFSSSTIRARLRAIISEQCDQSNTTHMPAITNIIKATNELSLVTEADSNTNDAALEELANQPLPDDNSTQDDEEKTFEDDDYPEVSNLIRKHSIFIPEFPTMSQITFILTFRICMTCSSDAHVDGITTKIGPSFSKHAQPIQFQLCILH